VGTGQAREIETVVRYQPVRVDRALRMANSDCLGFASVAYLFDLSNGLSATGCGLNRTRRRLPSQRRLYSTTMAIKPRGSWSSKASSAATRCWRSIFCSMEPRVLNCPTPANWVLLVDASGDRSLGLEAAQLLAVAHWLRATSQASVIKVETDGIRNQVIALVAAALDPEAFNTLTSHDGLKNLG